MLSKISAPYKFKIIAFLDDKDRDELRESQFAKHIDFYKAKVLDFKEADNKLIIEVSMDDGGDPI